MPVSKAEKHSKAETGKLFREFGASRIPKFCAFAEKNAVSLANQDCKGGQNGHVDRAIASGVHKKSGKQSQKAQLFAVLAQGIYTKHEYFNAKTLVGMTGFGIKKATTYQKPQAKSGRRPPSSKARTGRQPQKAALFAALHKRLLHKKDLGVQGCPLVGVRLLRKENAPHF